MPQKTRQGSTAKQGPCIEELIAEVGPNGDLEALVEDDGRVVFLYLHRIDDGAPEVRTVWVRNRIPAPKRLDREGMRQGDPPLMPAEYCRRPTGAPALKKNKLRLVWLPEGDGVALLEGAELLAALPPWSGVDGFHGYSADAIGQGPLAWDLLPAESIRSRFKTAEAVWAEWDRDPGPWPSTQQAQLRAYAAVLGKEKRYFAIDGGRWPPKALAWFETPAAVVLATIGVALRPQPTVEQYVDDPVPLRRIELGMTLPAGAPRATVEDLCGWMSSQSNLPWAQHSWLGPGHSIPVDLLSAYGFRAVILAPAATFGTKVSLPPCFGDPVSLLWMVPVTKKELDQAKRSGSASVLDGMAYPRDLRR